ncbi:MAG: hypothetical protein ABSC95_18330 [Acetobacteraceae bacterium]
MITIRRLIERLIQRPTSGHESPPAPPPSAQPSPEPPIPEPLPVAPREWAELMNRMRDAGRLDEVDDLWARAPADIQGNLAVASIWASLPRVRRDPAEMLRRAEWLVAQHPDVAKPVSHLIYALAATGPYAEVQARIAEWEARWPGDWDVLGPAADVALAAGDRDRAIALWERLAIERPEFYGATTRRSHVIALSHAGRKDEAAALLAASRVAFPEYPHFDGLGVE